MPTPLRAIRVDDTLWEAVQAKAASEGTSVSEVVRSMLAQWVDE